MKPADYLRAMAIQKVEEALAENIAFDAIYSQSDSMAMGAVLALKKAGVPIFGYGKFLTILVNFLIIAFVIFQLVRAANKLAKPAPAAPVCGTTAPTVAKPVGPWPWSGAGRWLAGRAEWRQRQCWL
jgi:large-conductance mechanosensitive channel